MHQMPRSKSLLSVRELAEALVFIVATHADVVDGHDETEALKAVLDAFVSRHAWKRRLQAAQCRSFKVVFLV